jgi:hypothetical protein
VLSLKLIAKSRSWARVPLTVLLFTCLGSADLAGQDAAKSAKPGAPASAASSAQASAPAAAPSAPAALPTSGAKAPTNDWASKTFELKYIDPEQVRSLFSERSFVMETNRDLMSLTAHGSAAFLKEVEDAIGRFDVPPPPPGNIQITVSLLTIAAQAPTGRPLPKELTAIGKELTTAGAPGVKLADSQMMRVRVGGPGEALGLAGAPDAATLSRIRIQSASLTPSLKGDLISLNGLHVWFSIPSETPDATPAPRAKPDKTDADISVSVDVTQNQAVVVSNAGTDKPVVVVVRASLVQ